jgi:hypothetical protein
MFPNLILISPTTCGIASKLFAMQLARCWHVVCPGFTVVLDRLSRWQALSTSSAPAFVCHLQMTNDGLVGAFDPRLPS